jgi:uncharacterized protein YbcV (DUF1398 family)
MFTLAHIKEAHSHVKSGADFPTYVEKLAKLGVRSYTCYVHDGHTDYAGDDGYHIQTDTTITEPLVIDELIDIDMFKERLKIHQQGGTSFSVFLTDAAQAGIDKWTTDITARTCTYYDKTGNEMLVETIPSP